MGFSNKLKAVIQSPSEQTSVVNSHFTFHPHANQDCCGKSHHRANKGSIPANVALVSANFSDTEKNVYFPRRAYGSRRQDYML